MHGGDIIEAGKYLSSPNGRYRLIMQLDGNLVLYARGTTGYQTPVWSSDTPGRGTPPHKLLLQGDGNLVVYDVNSVPIWDTSTHETRAIRLILQDDRNVVLYDGKGKALWSTDTFDG